MAKVKIGVNEIRKYVGRDIGRSKWIEVTQGRVNKFAEATGDFQWIHMDEERARSDLPTTRTIAHNFLLLSLIPQLFDQIVEITGLRYGLNRGADNIAFLTPLPTGAWIRIRVSLLKIEYVDQKGMTATFHIIMDRRDREEPVLTVDLKLLFVAGKSILP